MMLVFLLVTLLGVALGVGLLFRPFWSVSSHAALSRQQLNAAIYRDQFARLERDLADGLLAQTDYEQARSELQRRVLEDAVQDTGAARVIAPRTTLWALGIGLPLAVAGLYLLLGSPATLDPNGPQKRPTAQDIDRMVEGLERKLEKEPDNLQGWLMLGRSYKMLGRSQDAEKAFERAMPMIEQDAQLLAVYADLLASNAEGSFKGKPLELIQKAIQLDPNNAMALWLLGSALFSQDQFEKAIQVWQKLAPQLEPDSEDAKMLNNAMDAAYARMGGPALQTAPKRPASK